MTAVGNSLLPFGYFILKFTTAMVGYGGSILVSSGFSSDGTSGKTLIESSPSGPNGVSGDVSISTGYSQAGSSGIITLQTGSSKSGAGVMVAVCPMAAIFSWLQVRLRPKVVKVAVSLSPEEKALVLTLPMVETAAISSSWEERQKLKVQTITAEA